MFVKYSPRVDSFPGVFGTSIGGGILRQTGLSASRVGRGERASGAAALGRLERRRARSGRFYWCFTQYNSTKDILHAATRGRPPGVRSMTFPTKTHLLNYLLGFPHHEL